MVRSLPGYDKTINERSIEIQIRNDNQEDGSTGKMLKEVVSTQKEALILL